MKRLIFLILIITPLLASAYDFERDGIYYNILESELYDHEEPICEVTFATKIRGDILNHMGTIYDYQGEVTIPQTVEYEDTEYKVIGIGYRACAFCELISFITLPEGLEYIDDYAFLSCQTMKFPNIPSTVRSIGIYAFDLCIEFKKITIPANIEHLGICAFSGCTSLKTAEILCDLTEIPANTFSYTDLVEITIPKTVTTIGEGAFYECSNLESISLPQGLQTIEDNVFATCKKIASINIPDGVSHIGTHAFYDCSNMYAIHLPQKLKGISIDMLMYCKQLVEARIPENVKYIQNMAFAGDISLRSVHIMGNVDTIEAQVFLGCHQLTDVYCHASIIPSADSLAFSDAIVPIPELATAIAQQATLHVPAEMVDAYKRKYPWSEFAAIVAIEDETAIHEVEGRNRQLAKQYYTIDGKASAMPHPGLNIVDGHKVLVK